MQQTSGAWLNFGSFETGYCVPVWLSKLGRLIECIYARVWLERAVSPATRCVRHLTLSPNWCTKYPHLLLLLHKFSLTINLAKLYSSKQKLLLRALEHSAGEKMPRKCMREEPRIRRRANENLHALVNFADARRECKGDRLASERLSGCRLLGGKEETRREFYVRHCLFSLLCFILTSQSLN